MRDTKVACGITLEWLYESIRELQRIAHSQAHKKFLAARLIQKTFRGYLVRKSIKICHETAITIQKNYRRYRARQQFFELLEQTIRDQFCQHFNHEATNIQKIYRGFYSRKYINDFMKLRQTQRQAAKDLILCVAHKLHHLLRTKQIPGIYSLRNSNCLSKVEELLASLRFKEYNEQVRKERSAYKQSLAVLATARKDGKIKLNVPFGTPCRKFYQKSSPKEMHQMLDKFDDRPPRVRPKIVPISAITVPDDGLYAKVVSSMERCNIVKFDDMSVCPNVRPDKIEQFCSEMTNICESQRLYA
ncbi:unnamed protein product [Hermetia illucens]|uniref:Spermatogenesis-associated protein 17 n=1 Tax=Hermetia illucens TaxID=343691 RepID=A0A7R8UGV4_HERIL|nr:uncharacterized protein LOC119650289 [Hermetia illucens]CAD7080374.1 unnamed protein product [Hermetia illucens]